MSLHEAYAFQVYYIPRATNKYDVHITITPNIPSYIESVRRVYEGAERGSNVMATKIITREISFVLPQSTNGWELTSMTKPLTLKKSMIEDYEPGKPVPHIALHLKLRDDSNPSFFMDRIKMTGVKPPDCVVTLMREPKSVPEEEKPPQYKTVENLKEEIARSLSDGPDQYLLTQFKLKGWLIGPGPDPDVPGMINVALHRIKSNVSDYDDFIGMLQEIPQAKDILETIMGMCPSTLSNISDTMLFTRGNILAAAKNVKDTDRLGDYLGVPARRWRQIKTNFSNDRQRRLVEYIKFFMDHCPMASWRMVIVAMDELGETEEADKIRHLAEPVQDPTLTIENLRGVTSSVRNWLKLGSYDSGLGIPKYIREQIRTNDDYKTEHEKNNALLLYFLKNVPMASWSRVAQALHYNEEETALLAVKEYLTISQELNFTSENLSKVLESMSDDLWRTFGTYVYIPRSKLDTIKQECSSDRKCKEALIPLLVDSHPTPSWQLICWGLYQTADDEEGDDTCLKSIENLRQFLADEYLYMEAMSTGHVESGQAVLILMGVTGSGKTEFKRLMLGQKVLEYSPSTPLAQPAVRSMSVCQVAADGIEWTIVGPQKMVNMVASTIKGKAENSEGITNRSSNSLSVSVENERKPKERGPVSSNTPTQSDSQRLSKEEEYSMEDEQCVTPEELSDDCEPAFLEALEKIKIDKDLLESMKKPSGVVVEQLMDVDFIYLLDSGGQPPFREMLPHFVEQASAVVLMQKLNERLDFKPTIRYREEGGKVDKGYTSQLTNEQILHQYIQAVQSHDSKVFVIGTHRDKEGECEGETREDKNKKLLKALKSILGKQMELYKVGNPDQLIFPMNCTSRELDDEAIAREFRKRVMEKCMGEKKKIPMSWFILEQLLQSLAQEMGVTALTIKQCCEAAKQKLHMTPKHCEAALRYLGRLNIIFFRPDILSGVVFSSAQVILDKLTELVRCNHALRTKGSSDNAVPSYIHSSDGERFKELGLLNSELLEKAFPSHYREGLFTAPDLLLLLERMLIAGRLNSGEHFIPSLLPDLPVEKIAEYRATADHPPPLVIYYPKKWLPVGVMSSLVVYLQNECNWVPAEENDEPTCMKHNCIEFELPADESGSIVLIDSIKYLEIHTKPDIEVDSSILQGIRDDIMTGLKRAHESLHYESPEAKIGFLCSCENEGAHVAEVLANKKCRCSKNRRFIRAIDEGQKIWLGEDDSHVNNDAHIEENRLRHPTFIATDDLHDVRKVVLPVIARWKHIGLALRLDLGQLKKIKKENSDDLDDCLTEMLSLWLNKNYNTERFGEPSWELLAKAIGHPSGGNDSALADEIRQFRGFSRPSSVNPEELPTISPRKHSAPKSSSTPHSKRHKSDN